MQERTNRSSRRRFYALAATLLALLGIVPFGTQSATAAPANAGSGTFTGEVTYAFRGIPPLNTPCRSTNFTFSVAATITLANGDGSFGTWVLNPPVGSQLTGSGSSTCENSTIGGGTLTVDPIDVINPVLSTRLRCTQLNGAFTRLLTDVTAVLGGDCFIDTFDAGRVAIYVRGHFAPSPQTGNGITTNVTKATVAGSFTVVPAGSVG